MILPFIEQTNLYNQLDFNRSPYDPAFRTQAETVIPAFLCPSAPDNPRILEYDIAQFLTGMSTIMNGANFTGARVDYQAQIKTRGAACWTAFQDCPAPLVPDNQGRCCPEERGIMGVAAGGSGAARMNFSWNIGSSRIRDISDGTSNTLLLTESTNRNLLYNRRNLIPPTISAPLMDSRGGGAWIDLWKLNTPAGTSFDGATNGGPCLINCSNGANNAFYSWHPGGAQGLLSDGSVRFVSENTDLRTMIKALQAQDGLVLGEW